MGKIKDLEGRYSAFSIVGVVEMAKQAISDSQVLLQNAENGKVDQDVKMLFENLQIFFDMVNSQAMGADAENLAACIVLLEKSWQVVKAFQSSNEELTGMAASLKNTMTEFKGALSQMKISLIRKNPNEALTRAVNALLKKSGSSFKSVEDVVASLV